MRVIEANVHLSWDSCKPSGLGNHLQDGFRGCITNNVQVAGLQCKRIVILLPRA